MYFIFVLFLQSVRWYVCELEKTIISVCGKYGIKASTSPHTGVWVGDNKICAMGTTQQCSEHVAPEILIPYSVCLAFSEKIFTHLSKCKSESTIK